MSNSGKQNTFFYLTSLVTAVRLLLLVSNFNIIKTLTLLMHAGLFGCFCNPSNSEMDYWIFDVSM